MFDCALMDVRLLRVVVGRDCKRSSSFNLAYCSRWDLGRVIVTGYDDLFLPLAMGRRG